MRINFPNLVPLFCRPRCSEHKTCTSFQSIESLWLSALECGYERIKSGYHLKPYIMGATRENWVIWRVWGRRRRRSSSRGFPASGSASRGVFPAVPALVVVKRTRGNGLMCEICTNNPRGLSPGFVCILVCGRSMLRGFWQTVVHLPFTLAAS